MKSAILVQHISKKFSRNANTHLGYGMTDLWRSVIGREPDIKLRDDEFYAVDDVSLSVEPGESVALIGRNGSGKTTLLKMMNGLSKPDAGTITINGRVQALINLGAGFNPSLSGIDNILNSASLMGLNRRESMSLIDEIVDFSELDEFIESPVGTYSSGMKARLGFSVAVHLTPDVLLIDEVLSVGDYAFQNQCFARMEELKSAGVTIVFVSHNHSQVVKLCERAIWLHRGRIMHQGAALETVQRYLNFLDSEGETKALKESERREKKESTQALDEKRHTGTVKAKDSLYGPVYPEFDKVEDVVCELRVNGVDTDSLPVHSAVEIYFSFRLKQDVRDLCSTLAFYRKDGMRVAAIASLRDGRLTHIHRGRVCCEVMIPDLDFVPGPYVIMMPISDGQEYLWRNVVKEFYITGGGEIYVGVKDIKHEYKVYVQ